MGLSPNTQGGEGEKDGVVVGKHADMCHLPQGTLTKIMKHGVKLCVFGVLLGSNSEWSGRLLHSTLKSFHPFDHFFSSEIAAGYPALEVGTPL